MANKTIGELTAADLPLTGAELVHIVQGGNSRRVEVEDLFGPDVALKTYVDAHGVVQQAYFQTGAVASGTTTIPLDDTIPQSTEGTEFMTLAFTPKSGSNVLKIEVTANVFISTATYAVGALFQDSQASALAASVIHTAAATVIRFTHFLIAGATTPITFKFRAGPSAASTMTFNGVSGNRQLGGRMASSIAITELKP